MARSTFTLRVVTVTSALFDGEAEALHCRGVDGQLTVLARHEPLITRLEPGVLRVVAHGGEEQAFSVAEGVLEVADNKAVVLCSSDERDLPA